MSSSTRATVAMGMRLRVVMSAGCRSPWRPRSVRSARPPPRRAGAGPTDPSVGGLEQAPGDGRGAVRQARRPRRTEHGGLHQLLAQGAVAERVDTAVDAVQPARVDVTPDRRRAQPRDEQLRRSDAVLHLDQLRQRTWPDKGPHGVRFCGHVRQSSGRAGLPWVRVAVLERSRDVDVVILCGGRGTRLQERTQAIPKPLVEIGGRPILWHVIALYAAPGLPRFLLLHRLQGRADRGASRRRSWPAGVDVRVRRHRGGHADRRPRAPAARAARGRAASAPPTPTASPTSTSRALLASTPATAGWRR